VTRNAVDDKLGHASRSRALIGFCAGFVAWGAIVVGAFYLTTQWLPVSGQWRPFVSAIPGLSLCGLFLPLYLYLKAQDENARSVTLRALAMSSIAGVCTHLISVTRATIGGYHELGGATLLVVMALVFVVSAAYLQWRQR